MLMRGSVRNVEMFDGLTVTAHASTLPKWHGLHCIEIQDATGAVVQIGSRGAIMLLDFLNRELHVDEWEEWYGNAPPDAA